MNYCQKSAPSLWNYSSSKQPIIHQRVCTNNGMVSITHFKLSDSDIISKNPSLSIETNSPWQISQLIWTSKWKKDTLLDVRTRGMVFKARSASWSLNTILTFIPLTSISFRFWLPLPDFLFWHVCGNNYKFATATTALIFVHYLDYNT